MQWWKQTPSLQTKRIAFTLVTQRAAAGFTHSIAGRIVSPLISCHSLHSPCPPPLVVEAAQEPLSMMTLTPEEPSECSLELFAGAGVNHGVDAAVEVTQPKDYLEHSFRWFQRREEGT